MLIVHRQRWDILFGEVEDGFHHRPALDVLKPCPRRRVVELGQGRVGR
jgi:hypothetical protein